MTTMDSKLILMHSKSIWLILMLANLTHPTCIQKWEIDPIHS